MSEYSLIAAKVLVPVAQSYNYWNTHVACVALPDGSYFVAASYSGTNDSYIRCWHLDVGLGTIGSLDIALTVDNLSYRAGSLPVAYIHEGMQVILHGHSTYGDIGGKRVWLIDCTATPVILDSASVAFIADRTPAVIKIAGTVLIGSGNYIQGWKGLAKVSECWITESWLPTSGQAPSGALVAMFWPHPSDLAKVMAVGRGDYTLGDHGNGVCAEITVLSNGTMSYDTDYSLPSLVALENVYFMGSPYGGYLAVNEVTTYTNGYASWVSTLTGYLTPDTVLATLPSSANQIEDGLIARLSNQKFLTLEKVHIAGTSVTESPRILAVDPVAGTMEPLYLPVDSTFMTSPRLKIDYYDLPREAMALDADEVTGHIFAGALMVDGNGVQGLQVWSIQGPPGEPLPTSAPDLSGALLDSRVRFSGS